jgi:hypothetical protein
VVSPKSYFQTKNSAMALVSLRYTNEEIGNILELLTDNKDFWQDTRDFDESAVAPLGF